MNLSYLLSLLDIGVFKLCGEFVPQTVCSESSHPNGRDFRFGWSMSHPTQDIPPTRTLEIHPRPPHISIVHLLAMCSGTTSAVPRSRFLDLPLELREQIYHHYFRADGGYVYDGTTDTLTQIDDKPVDIALRYACRSVAHETREYLFQLNPIKFSTVYRDDWQDIAGSLI